MKLQDPHEATHRRIASLDEDLLYLFEHVAPQHPDTLFVLTSDHGTTQGAIVRLLLLLLSLTNIRVFIFREFLLLYGCGKDRTQAAYVILSHAKQVPLPPPIHPPPNRIEYLQLSKFT